MEKFVSLLCDKFFFLIVMSAHLEIHTNKTNLKKRKSFPFTKGDLNTQEVRLEKVFKDLKQFSFHDLIYHFVTSLKFRTPHLPC